MSFIHDDFLLSTPLARRLYHEVAESQPIIDYHSHLPPGDVAADRRFGNLFDIWLAGDHYKWRAMRSNGEAEKYCTGDAPPYEKFLALARTIPNCLRNPLYHWCHIELKRYFGIDELLTPESAPRIWEQANARLADPDRGARAILTDFKVEVICTTDDPADPLTHHETIAAAGIGTTISAISRARRLAGSCLKKLISFGQAMPWSIHARNTATCCGVSFLPFFGITFSASALVIRSITVLFVL